MLFTHLYIDNLYNFHNTSIDFTLKRKILNSSVADEYLAERPNFRFKRVCIVSGANASGKTSLGRILRYIQHFILFPNSNLLNKINHKEKEAIIRVEFVLPATNTIHYLEIKQTAENIKNYPHIVYSALPIRPNDTAYSARKRLMSLVEKCGETKIDGAIYHQNTNAPYLFEDIKPIISDHLCFYYMFSNTQDNDKSEITIKKDSYLNKDILENILKNFDPSISSVNELMDKDELEAYVIRFKNKDSVIINKTGEIVNQERLSKGTFDAIQVAEFFAFIKEMASFNQKFDKQTCATYFLDEKMAYSHSELEQAMVNLIIQTMGRYSQFIYTTHNYDVLDMNLPVHSFLFVRKEDDSAEFVQPETLFKKNDRSLLNYIQNNIFYTIPDTSLIDELLFPE
ncbi:hypothetical protein [Lonepinella sp. MS14436]|uniref:hypothetical protein n=1 Tax=Lonepinella sp. MS14436 TaxID=3003619 RepID=UPI0036D9712E